MEFSEKNVFQKISFEIKDLISQRRENIKDIIDKANLDIDKIKFISIGANDGVINDPVAPYIKTYNWEGIYIEPIPEYFDQLRSNYKNNKNIILEKVAIGGKEGEEEIYFIDPNGPSLTNLLGKRLASFNKRVIESHSWYIPKMKENIKKEMVAVKPLEKIIEKNNYWNANLLTIDVEGYESEIIKGINFKKFKPRIIYFETKHLKREEYEKIERLLKGEGYRIFKLGRDSYGINSYHS